MMYAKDMLMTVKQYKAVIIVLAGWASTYSFASPSQAGNGAESAYFQYVAAWKAKNLPALDAVIADDYMTLNGQKKVSHKSDEIEEAKTSPAYDEMQIDEIHSLVVGNTAVVSSLLTVAGSDGGKAYKVQVRDLATFLKRNGHWQLIADQSAN